MRSKRWSKSECPLCGSRKGIKHTCQVCHRQNCRDCCKRYLALEENPVKQVRTCNECFLEHVAWDASRTYDVYGSAGDKPVVLVHGALVGRHCLSLEAQALSEVGFRVIVPDLPAHGARFKEHPLTLDTAVAALYDEVVQKEAPGKKVVIMGFSMGGYVAAAFAATHPELMAGVLLGGCCHDAHTRTWQAVGRMAETVYRLCSYRTKSQFTKSAPELMSPQRLEIQQCFLRAGAEYDAWKYAWRVSRIRLTQAEVQPEVMYQANMRKLLPKITCPALLVVGEHDSRSHEQKWLSLLQHGNLLVLKGGIHQFMFQPGVCHEFRINAEGFAAAASWEEPLTAGHSDDNPNQQPVAAVQPLLLATSSGPGQTSKSAKAVLALAQCSSM